MYSWLLNHMSRRWANFFILCWYLLLLYLIALSIQVPQGRFRYLEW